jgi:hypothetical protein
MLKKFIALWIAGPCQGGFTGLTHDEVIAYYGEYVIIDKPDLIRFQVTDKLILETASVPKFTYQPIVVRVWTDGQEEFRTCFMSNHELELANTVCTYLKGVDNCGMEDAVYRYMDHFPTDLEELASMRIPNKRG